LFNVFEQKNVFNDEQNIFDILDQLINRIITGHDAINYVIDLIKFVGQKYEELIYCIIDKDLNANINIAIINSISPNAILEFKVALAERFDEAPDSRVANFASGN
jgi:hypothetical protein